MKLFVGGKWEQRHLIKQYIDLFESHGHTQTHDWTSIPDAGTLPVGERQAYLAKHGQLDLDGVGAAEVFVMVAHPNGRGVLVEKGYALAKGIPVIVVDRSQQEHIYHDLAGVVHVYSITEALDLVDTLADADRMASEMR